MSTNSTIRRALATRGYTNDIHQQFWSLLLDVSGFREPIAVDVVVHASSALAEIDQWDDPTFRIARAALHYDFKEAYDFVFDRLDPAPGIGALVSAKTLLDRLDELESSPKREATRDADHAALARLAQRGITPEERARVRALIVLAKGEIDDFPAEIVPDDVVEKLLKLRAKYREWSEVAKVVIRRRADLIRLGLAKRRKAVSADEDEGDDEDDIAPDVAVAAPPAAPQPVAPVAPIASAPAAPPPTSNGAAHIPA